MHPQPTLTGPETQTERLRQVCRELADHLSAYAISADNFDDEAFATCEKAERLLFDIRLSPVREPLTDCCGGVITEIDGYEVCSGCGTIQI